jgi:hypothetical protein
MVRMRSVARMRYLAIARSTSCLTICQSAYPLIINSQPFPAGTGMASVGEKVRLS